MVEGSVRWFVRKAIIWARPVPERALCILLVDQWWAWWIAPRPDLSGGEPTRLVAGRAGNAKAAMDACEAAWAEMLGSG